LVGWGWGGTTIGNRKKPKKFMKFKLKLTSTGFGRRHEQRGSTGGVAVVLPKWIQIKEKTVWVKNQFTSALTKRDKRTLKSKPGERGAPSDLEARKALGI